MTKPQLKLFNSLTREKQNFTPIDPANVGMYVCGVTPYDHSHIGHARAYVVFDVLYRLLRHVYGENHVTYVRNFTDIDDKIIERAQEVGQEPTALAQHFIADYHEDMDALNILRPNFEPRVSTSMSGIVEMVDVLLAKNKAYVTASGDVMFDVPGFERTGGHQPFGTLARRTFDKLQARVEGDDEKRDPRDFPIWKANAKSATKLEQAFHPEQLGAKHFSAPGRPGWHIECSVMSKEHLGPTFDIHGGGEDLQFPHHSCEIAQSEALLPAGQPMANYWMHNNFITVNGTKMSKSLGNFLTIKDALRRSGPGGIRLWLLQTHYRKPVDYSDEALQASQNRLSSYVQSSMGALLTAPDGMQIVDTHKIPEEFFNALADDLNISMALSVMDKEKDTLSKAQMLNFLGINGQKSGAFETHKPLDAGEVELVKAREEARAAKNWKLSDELRDQLKAEGILVEDGPQGQTWRRL